MNKIWISFNFYLLLTINVIAIMNPISKWGLAAIVLDIIFIPAIRLLPEKDLYEIAGITWLQKKFKNNKVIMDMTNE